MEDKDFNSLKIKSFSESETKILLAKKLNIPSYLYLAYGILIILLVVIWWAF